VDLIKMRKVFLFFLSFLLASSTVTPVIAVNQTALYQDIRECPYNTSWYKRDVFDCSNMAVWMRDYLEEQGYTAYVKFGLNTSIGIAHVWVQVNGYVVEPTTKDWAWWHYKNNGSYGWIKWDHTGILPKNWKYMTPREWNYEDKKCIKNV